MNSRSNRFQFFPFIICLLIPLAIGAIGGFLTFESVKTWYTTLNKPSFNPPNWIFGPVWTTLYILMGISSYLVWQRRKIVSGYSWAVGVYLLQLLLNLMWSYLFFYQQQIGFALIEIGILLLTIIVNTFIFYRINKIAGLLFIPYILWVSFASYLTYSIFILN
ncbi:tryptophan-rich sensory protein [Pedobacter frigiditerrae]|uniref:Tryptophan-rich sensory protein n=1 Tax=Pedobacter frigiditerrae TaxID=2530452 RepID=A0A4R0MS16_9SPHI|nr:TspO/MBR family protein [Pedobacter frigiditerrae]TCC89417.1 tryptophan-rich sensory protein [Pedobacter frigiditerrae]